MPSVCKVVSDMPSVCNIVSDMPSVCKVVSDMPLVCNVVSYMSSMCNVVSDMPSVCNVVPDMPSVCNVVSDMPSVCNIVSDMPSVCNVALAMYRGSVTYKTSILTVHTCGCNTWWRHQMETFSALLAFVQGILCSRRIPTKKASDASFDVFFDLRLIKWWSKQSWGWWFDKSSRPLWRLCNVIFHQLCCV